MEENLNKPSQAFKVAINLVKDLNREIDKLDVKDDCEIDDQFWATLSDELEEMILLSFNEGKNLAISAISEKLINIDFEDPGWSIDDILTELKKKIL